MSVFKKLSILLHSVHVYVHINNKLGYRWQTAWRIVQKQWRGWPPKNTLLPILFTLPNLVVLRQTIPALLKRSAWKFDSLSWSLKVIGTHTDRSAVCDFLLMSRSNYGPISYRFQDKRRFQSKIAKFPTPVYFAPRWRGSLGTGYQRSESKKLEWWSYRERSLTISSASG